MDAPGANTEEYNTWSANGDLKIAFTPTVSFLAEAYTGSNTASYFGAILNGDCTQNLRSAGGWANLQFKPSKRVALSIGGGVDQLLNEEDTSVAGTPNARVKNAQMFGNAVYTVYPGVNIGAEVSAWTTDYINLDAGMDASPTNVRLQLAIQSHF